jgi:hypothetical protein
MTSNIIGRQPLTRPCCLGRPLYRNILRHWFSTWLFDHQFSSPPYATLILYLEPNTLFKTNVFTKFYSMQFTMLATHLTPPHCCVRCGQGSCGGGRRIWEPAPSTACGTTGLWIVFCKDEGVFCKIFDTRPIRSIRWSDPAAGSCMPRGHALQPRY